MIGRPQMQDGLFMNRLIARASRGWWLLMVMGALLPLSTLAQTVTSLGRVNPPASGIERIRIRPGDWVEITGSGLTAVRSIRFGLATATFSGNSTRLVAVVPPGATIGPLSLSDSFGLFFATDFNFQVSPRVTGFGRSIPAPSSPADAIQGAPGNSVLFTGENFVDPSDPTFTSGVFFPASGGGYLRGTTEFVSSTSIQVKIPAGAVSGVPVVSNPSGDGAAPGNFYLQPLVTSIDPPRAKVGDVITLKGISLLGTSEVLFGATRVVPSQVTSTNVVVTVPALTQSVQLTVTSPGGSFLTASSLVLLPRITSFTPTGGAPGTVVTLNGDGLAASTGVWFGGVEAVRATNVSASRVDAVVPASALAGPITLTTVNGTNVTTTPFIVAPTISDYQPAQAKPGVSITILGSNFTNVSRVQFAGGVDAVYTVVASNRITATVPLGAVSGPVKVTNSGGESSSTRSFVVLTLEPVIFGFTPTSGAAGTTVRINGDNLSSATEVRFNGLAVANFTVNGETNLVTALPAGATSGKISVVTPSGTVVSAADFLVGTTADLLVTGQVLPLAPIVGDEATFTFRVQNRGPLNSVGANFTLQYPGATYIEATTSQGTFDAFGSTVVVTAGTIARNDSLLVNVRVRTRSTAAVTATGQVTSDTPDPTTADQRAQVTIVPVQPSLNVSRLEDGRVELSWPSQSSTLILQDAADPLGPWQTTSGTPESTGNGRRLILTPLLGERVYRLRMP